MDKLELFSKCLNLVEGRENPESWWGWWNEHESEVEKLLNHGEFLKLKPRSHGFSWVPVFGSQKGAITILEKNGITPTYPSLSPRIILFLFYHNSESVEIASFPR